MSCHSTLSSRPFLRRTLSLASAILLSGGSIAYSQDAVRPSLAGEAASEARRQDIERIPYNLMVGPVRFRFSATAGIEYNDNINLADDGDELDDFIFRPHANLNAIWPVTQINTLRFDIGIGYAFYLDHSEANTNGILLAPNSQIAFDIFVGDFRINIHDRFSLQQDPIAELGLSNVVDYGRFQNYAGISVLWDLNKALLTLGYDHYNYISTTDDFDYLDRSSEIVSGSLGFLLTSTTTVGLEASYIFNDYDQSLLNDSDTYSIGAFLETQLSQYLRARVAGGYQKISFEGNGVVLGPFPSGVLTPIFIDNNFPGASVRDGTFVVFNDDNDFNNFYVNLLISHRLNSRISHSLSAGHEAQLGVNSNYIELNYVRHTITWNVVRNTLLSTEIFYEDADDSGGYVNEHLHRYGGALTIGYQLTPHITLGLRYQYTEKDSDVAFRDYDQNRVSLDGTYSF